MLIGSITALLWVPLAVSQGLSVWTVMVGIVCAFLFGSREERRQERGEHERLVVDEPWEKEPFEDRATPPPILYV